MCSVKMRRGSVNTSSVTSCFLFILRHFSWILIYSLLPNTSTVSPDVLISFASLIFTHLKTAQLVYSYYILYVYYVYTYLCWSIQLLCIYLAYCLFLTINYPFQRLYLLFVSVQWCFSPEFEMVRSPLWTFSVCSCSECTERKRVLLEH